MASLESRAIAISGNGQFHTNKNRNPYVDVTLKHIQALVDNPQTVGKSEAKWIIPSTYPSRIFKDQEQKGEYWLLWADLDKLPPSLDVLATCIDELDCSYEIYTSRSATEDNQKSRILLPLNKPLCFAEWQLSQEALNDFLAGKSITPDEANKRAAQLCYLPNRGEYYNAVSDRVKAQIDPLSLFSAEIEAKKNRLQKEQETTRQRIEKSKAKREAIQSHEFDSPIDAFNEAYEVEQILLRAGYDQKGSAFRHPKSESGSYSASIQLDSHGRYRVHSLSTADPLYSNGEGAHDAFSAFCTLFHNGNSDAALKDAGDNWLAIGVDSWNSVKQREYREAQNDAELPPDASIKSPSDILRDYSATGQSKALREKMLKDEFVLDGLAILGQWTTIYAAPNTGKTLITLWLINEQVASGKINPDNIFYVNVDDTYKGGVEKTEIAERINVHMLLPGVNDFDKNKLFSIVEKLIEADEARGIVIILDTLKKFVDIMDKAKSSDFGERARKFVASGGTLICLAHVNKHKDSDGGSIFSGTADIVDDADCAFIIEDLGRTEEFWGSVKNNIEFRNIKARGDVAEKAAFTFTTENGAGYFALFESVARLAEGDVALEKEKARIKESHERDADVIGSIKAHIKEAELGKTELIEKIHEDTLVSKAKIQKTLKRWEGENLEKGHLWHCEKGDKNRMKYCILKSEIDVTMGNILSARWGGQGIKEE